jgi:glycosyltransferase 2 family protein
VRSADHRLRWILRAVAIAVVVGAVMWVIHGIDIASLGAVLAGAHLWPLVVAAAINFGLIACKAISWRILLGPAYPVPIARLISYTVTSCAASVIVPLRGGELIRLWLLRDRDGVPVTHSAAVAMAEKLLDIVSMLILVAPLPWLVRDAPASLTRWIAVLAIGVIVALVVLRAVSQRLPRTSWFGRFLEGMTIVHRPRVFAATVGVLFASWLIDLAMISLVMWAVGIDLPIGAGVLVLFTVNVTIAVPSTPGQFGALELGAMLGLHLLHVSEEKSLAFALAYHALQVVPIVVVGLALNARVLVSRWGEGS